MTGTQFHFLTLFPELTDSYMSTSILGRASARGLFTSHSHSIRRFAKNSHGTVDDVAFGGGGGMVLKVDVLVDAVETLRQEFPAPRQKTIYFSPRGRKLDEPMVREFSSQPTQWLLVCGHYEGADQRFIDGWVDYEISLGDFVLTGGELPALAFADALARQLEGTVSHDSRAEAESFSLRSESGKPLLEYPHYTRPRTFRGREVPEILLSGNHPAIEKWRKQASEEITSKLRPDL